MMACNPNFVLREIYDNAILMPIRNNEVGIEPIHLNDIAVTIWKQTGECKTRDDLLAAITALYNLEAESPEQIAVQQFIEQLLEMKLIFE